MDGINRSCAEIFTLINKHMIEATMYHEEMANYFDFIGLQGFKRMHEYQYYSESIGRRKLNGRFINAKLKLVGKAEHVTVVGKTPAEWYGLTRMDVNNAVISKYTRIALADYRAWEHKTLEMLEGLAKELFEGGHIAFYEFIKCYVKDVEDELKRLNKLIAILNTVEYDVVYIQEIQKKMHDDFKEKEKKLCKKM